MQNSSKMNSISLEEEMTEFINNQNCPFLFTELLELTEYSDGVREWKEVTRWVKYEETVEEAGNRWSKPHVSTPSLHGLLSLRKHLKSGIIVLELQASNMNKISSSIADVLVTQGDLTRDTANRLVNLYCLKHRHQFEGPRKIDTGLTTVIKDLLTQKLDKGSTATSRVASPETRSRRGSVSPYRDIQDTESLQVEELSKDDSNGKVNQPFLKKLPADAEAAVLLVGRVAFLDKPISVFIRLAAPVVLGDLPEVDIPTRYLYMLVGPTKDGEKELNEIGRGLGSAFSDRAFAQNLSESDSSTDIVSALDDYIDSIKTLPRDWKPNHYIDPPEGENEKEKELLEDEEDVIDDDRRNRESSGLVRTGRLFGGLLNDIKRKYPHYWSDFKDGFHPQCISSFLFLYFACLAPIVAFGALLGEATGQRIATIEGLVAGLISGVLFSLFAGQPLNLLGSTGPVYVFEKILYKMCTDQEWDYLSLRLWIGIWVAIMLLLLVAFDASAYVCYITRFTEELFATLVAFIFIMSAFQKTYEIKESVHDLACNCLPPGTNITHEVEFNLSMYIQEPVYNLSKDDCIREYGVPHGPGCEHGTDVFLMSVLLFFGAFFISITLKQFRFTGYFPSWVRNFLSDFAVIIGILSMTGLDYFSGVPTPKLTVPSEFKPTWEGRSWLVTHALMFPDHLLANPWWVDVFLAPVFAILATILIFMDQQITAVIVNRKEYKLVKGCGYHLDLLVLAGIIVVSSVFGLPWFIANTIPSINHMQSLTKESETKIPGEKPRFLGIREQRVTNLLIAILTGLSVFMTPILALLPMPVLYGVFLFMGVMSLRGLQLFDRILLFLIPAKYQPNYVYLKYVPLSRVHLFTVIQLLSLAGLWMIKSYPSTSIAFPVMLVVICVIRKFVECVFSHQELRALDDLLPETGRGSRKLGYKINPFKESPASEDEVEGLNKETNSEIMRDTGVKRRQLNLARAELLEQELDELINIARIRKQKEVKSPKSPRAVVNNSNPDKRLLFYLKFEEDDIYTPLHLSPVNMATFKKCLAQKFSILENVKMEHILRRNAKGLIFPLDDYLLDIQADHQVFILSVKQGENGGIVVTLSEQNLG